MFDWHRDVPMAWADEVARLSPKWDRAGHLVLFWESGTPAEPAQRWVLYEAIPVAYVPAWKRDLFLADPPCRCPFNPGIHARCPRCQRMQSPGRARILAYLQQTECLALPFWVIQGDQGGHRHQYTQVEQQWQRLMRQPDEPPATGNLPYAPFDRRVVRRLLALQPPRRAFQHYQDATVAERQAAERAFRAALADYVDHAVSAAFDDLSLTRRSALVEALPRVHTDTRPRVDLAAQREAFIEGSA